MPLSSFHLDAGLAAERFSGCLDMIAGRRKRIALDDCFRAMYELDPSTIDAPDKRARLRELITTCQAAGVLTPAAATDRGRPPLPRSVTRTSGTFPTVSAVPAWPWRGELAWASELTLTLDEFEILRAVQEFLRADGSRRMVLPHRERSLELFGHEKTLDRIVRGRLFESGRLSFELLRARWCPPPLAWREVGRGSIALVVENACIWHSVVEALPAVTDVGLVAYGGGAMFSASVASFIDVPRIRAIRYAGDLDAAGLAIAQLADETAQRCGVPRVLPATSLYRIMLAKGRPQPAQQVPDDVADELAAWLPADLRTPAAANLKAGVRLAQEAVTLEVLANDPQWARQLDSDSE